MDKVYVLDTSALISNPNLFLKFNNSKVIIPIVVLSELDKLKKQQNETGKNARICIKNIDKITSTVADITVGALLDNNIFLQINIDYSSLSDDYVKFGPLDYGDTKILVTAYELNKEQNNVTLISNDINLRIKARAFGIDSEGCKENYFYDELPKGFIEVQNVDLGMQLASLDWVDPDEVPILNINEFVLFTDENNKGISAGRKISDDQIVPLRSDKPWGINSKNKEQAFAIDLLMDPSVDLVTLTGEAGCGKSLITIACALELIVHEKKYNKCIIYKPIESVGKDLGYLPGSVAEKITPYFRNIIDSLEYLAYSGGGSKKNNHSKSNLEYLKDLGKIEFEPLTYIRGRSISNTLIICDEAQNLTKNEIKTLLTRVSKGSKVILNGDINQIDNMSLDSENNGLTYVIKKFKNSEIAGHISLLQNERSKLAEEAANRL